MTDYKELIYLLRDESNCDVLDYIEDAATAIETLLAERDAAVDGLRGKCVECKYGKKYPWEPPCHICIFSGNNNCDKDYWQWRGTAKGDAQ